jgi:hypothetical protein
MVLVRVVCVGCHYHQVRGTDAPLPVDWCKLAGMECEKVVRCTVNTVNNTEEKYVRVTGLRRN